MWYLLRRDRRHYVGGDQCNTWLNSGKARIDESPFRTLFNRREVEALLALSNSFLSNHSRARCNELDTLYKSLFIRAQSSACTYRCNA